MALFTRSDAQGQTARWIAATLVLTGLAWLAAFAGLLAIADRVHVDCLDHRGDPVSIDAEGWYARILQHEIDHLNGILYIDRMKTRSFCTVANYERYWKNLSAAEFEEQIS